MPSGSAPRLIVRTLRKSDLAAIQDLQRRCFPGIEPWSREQLESQLATFPEGQLGIELDGKLVASSSSLIVDEEDFGAWHTLRDVSDGGLIRNHDPRGDTLYGIDIVVDPKHRGERLARRLYEARKELAARNNLRAILIAGRIPGFHEHAGLAPEEYVRKVVRKELKDPVLTAQLANGFAIRGVLRGYLPSDVESGGHAVFMEWLNPQHHPDGATSVRHARVAAVQYQMRPLTTFDEFAQQVEFFVDTASEYRMDFVLFPELITNQLLALVPAARPGLSARRLHEFTPRYLELFGHLAMKHNINIIGGSHLTLEGRQLYNIAYLFRRDGSVDRQYKLHITPSEERWWGVTAGNELKVFDTDRGKIAIAICYDVEFPEVARIAAAKGASILFVPFNTDLRASYLRVRACAQARCIENNLYAVLAGPVGNLPFVEGADVHYGQACILTPSDLQFARDGIAEEATPNVETMVVHELDLEVLHRNKRTGTVRTWLDRRTDLYSVTWSEGGKNKQV
ncbi:MAG: bifunctional GNAT family N-acetyltransferase/carbon-nitrogen hydrolase family protein [Myxococcales bacterium]|nr:bifunctional GNAT family N-acetyltransferase/carbon-nitrogen hydrolase family protein [Myxococcales bacterium]